MSRYAITVTEPRKGTRTLGHVQRYQDAATLVARLAPRFGPFHTWEIQRSHETKARHHP